MEIKINYDKELKITGKLDFPLWVEFFINDCSPDFETFYLAMTQGVCLLDKNGTVKKENVIPVIHKCGDSKYYLVIDGTILSECTYGKFWCFQKDVKVKKYYKGAKHED